MTGMSDFVSHRSVSTEDRHTPVGRMRGYAPPLRRPAVLRGRSTTHHAHLSPVELCYPARHSKRVAAIVPVVAMELLREVLEEHLQLRVASGHRGVGARCRWRAAALRSQSWKRWRVQSRRPRRTGADRTARRWRLPPGGRGHGSAGDWRRPRAAQFSGPGDPCPGPPPCCAKCLKILHPDQRLGGSKRDKTVVIPARQIKRIEQRLKKGGLDRNARRKLHRRRKQLLAGLQAALADRRREIRWYG